MYFETYDYITGNSIKIIEFFDFGDILQKRHCIKPLVFRAFQDSENSISDFKMYLESKGSWNNTEFGYYISQNFESSIQSGSPKLSNIMTEVSDASSTSPNGVSVPWDTTSSYYIWLDIQISDQTAMTNANYRFFYNYT